MLQNRTDCVLIDEYYKQVTLNLVVSEIRGGVSSAAAVVRSAAQVLKSKQIRLSKRNSPPRGHLVARHVLYYAWGLQRSAHTRALRPSHLP